VVVHGAAPVLHLHHQLWFAFTFWVGKRVSGRLANRMLLLFVLFSPLVGPMQQGFDWHKDMPRPLEEVQWWHMYPYWQVSHRVGSESEWLPEVHSERTCAVQCAALASNMLIPPLRANADADALPSPFGRAAPSPAVVQLHPRGQGARRVRDRVT
jgi:hypothetical protein